MNISSIILRFVWTFTLDDTNLEKYKIDDKKLRIHFAAMYPREVYIRKIKRDYPLCYSMQVHNEELMGQCR